MDFLNSMQIAATKHQVEARLMEYCDHQFGAADIPETVSLELREIPTCEAKIECRDFWTFMKAGFSTQV